MPAYLSLVIIQYYSSDQAVYQLLDSEGNFRYLRAEISMGLLVSKWTSVVKHNACREVPERKWIDASCYQEFETRSTFQAPLWATFQQPHFDEFTFIYVTNFSNRALSEGSFSRTLALEFHRKATIIMYSY